MKIWKGLEGVLIRSGEAGIIALLVVKFLIGPRVARKADSKVFAVSLPSLPRLSKLPPTVGQWNRQASSALSTILPLRGNGKIYLANVKTYCTFSQKLFLTVAEVFTGYLCKLWLWFNTGIFYSLELVGATRRVIGISGSLIWSKTIMELIFNPCGEFRWNLEGPVSQIHSSHLHVGHLGFFPIL